MAAQATAIRVCRLHGKRSAQARIWKPGRRRQGCGRLAIASPVRDERIANLEQRGRKAETHRVSLLIIHLNELAAFG